VTVHKLVLNGTPDDTGQLEKFSQRLSPIEIAGTGRLRVLAVELARRQELDVSAIAYEDEMLEIEVVAAGDRLPEPVSISRDKTGIAARCHGSGGRTSATRQRSGKPS
jgi:hypothetical protein